MSSVEALLRRERAIVGGGLAALTVLAWIYLCTGAGLGMSAREMTRFALFPHAATERMAEMPATDSAAPPAGDALPGASGMPMPKPMPGSSLATWTTVAAMWWVMMIAMMTPSAAPLVLLYGRVQRHHGLHEGAGSVYAPSALLVLGYLLVWLAFSLAAATLQLTLQRVGLISASLLSSRSAFLSAAVLVAAGIYQLSPLKRACLRHCRAPVEFLTHHWRPRYPGALALGAEHGAWCVGCCWMLMALLFVGGIMNLVWVALLGLLVLAEKVTPAGPLVSRIVGKLLIAWGIVTLVV